MSTPATLASAGFVLALGLTLAGCSTIEGVLDSGRGPFDNSPATTSEAALEGLHESSWGNSGKWGGKDPPETEPGEPETAQDVPPRG